MEIKQIAELVNDATLQVLGKDEQGNAVAVLQEDLANVVDIGKAVIASNADHAYLEALVNRIGRTIFVDRAYQGKAPKVLRDGWEYGSILAKYSTEIPDAEENETWELVDGASYDPNIFTKDKVDSKYFNKKTTFQIKKSITRVQLRQSFQSPEDLNRFISMLYVWVENSMTVKMDALIMRTIDNMIAGTVYADFGANNVSNASHVKAVNLLYLYNDLHDTSLTVEEAMVSLEFLRFATGLIGKYIVRMQSMSRLFNIGGKSRFTPEELLHVVMHADFLANVDTYLQAPTFHNEFNKLPKGEVVAYWQGTGGSYEFEDTSKINVKDAEGHEIELGGIVAVMFDHDALGVCNEEARTTSDWNAPAEFWNEWHKKDAQYFNDYNENFVVFFLA